MKLPSHALAITGMGVYTSLGRGLEENWQKLIKGCSGVREISRFPTAHLPTKIAATIDINSDYLERERILAHDVVEQALIQSQLPLDLFADTRVVIALAPLMEVMWSDRLAFSDSKCSDQFSRAYENISCAEFGNFLDKKYHFSNVPLFVNTACASGAHAIQLAAEQIRMGHTPVAMAVGVDTSVEVETLARFSLLSTLSIENDHPSQASKPFSFNRDGFVLGEGAAALILEDIDHARARGAKILAYLAGYGDITDNFHRTRNNPTGEKIVACMQRALDDANISITQVDYINAHGTSTSENDKMEGKAIQLLFDEHCQKLLVSSNKSMIGHTMSAAGAIEAVFSVLTLQHQIVPPTINYLQPDPDIPLNVVPNQAIAAPVNVVLSNSFGFGGQNASLVFVKE